ncbi:MAG: hypothetical protein AAF567_22470 [Actinomycetota bacterium]
METPRTTLSPSPGSSPPPPTDADWVGPAGPATASAPVTQGSPDQSPSGTASNLGSMPPPPPPPPSAVLPSPPPREPTDDPSRTGTLWVGATGVALLLAAAAVLTAVRWDEIGQTAKLAGFAVVTLAMLLGGRRLQSIIPLTGRAIFHLGALLIPLDMAALALLADRTWEETLLMTSLTAVVSWFALWRVDPSPVLEWAARGSVVLATAGVAAVSPVSMPLALAVVAAAATLALDPIRSLLGGLLGRRMWDRSALTWTGIAGLLPLAAFAEWPIQLADAVDELGFTPADRASLVAAGVVATVTSVWLAARRPSLERGWLTVVMATSTALTVGLAFDTVSAWAIGLAALFLGFEAAAFAVRRDALWTPLLATAGPIVEGAGALFTVTLLMETLDRNPSAGLAVAGALTLLAWFTADWRRLTEPVDWLTGLVYGSDWGPATVAIPASVFLVGAATGLPSLGLSVVVLATAVWAAVTGRTLAWLFGIVAGVVAVAITPLGLSGAGVALGSAVLVALAARFAPDDEEVGPTLASSTAVFLGAAWLTLYDLYGSPSLIALAVAAWIVGWVVDLDPTSILAAIPKGVAVLALVGLVIVEPAEGLMLTGAVAFLALVDVVRSNGAAIGATTVAAGSIALALIPGSELAGLTEPQTGVILAGATVVLIGLLIVLPRRFETPLGIAAGVIALVSVGMAEPEGAALAGSLMLIGGGVMLLGVATRAVAVVGAGALMTNAGTWLQLATWEVTWIEAYLAIPAAIAIWAGTRWHREGVSSWVAYAPTIAVFGGLAALDRFDGGSAWHAVIAGAVAVAAIAAGGIWRLAGPLITGTVLVGVVATYEALGPGSRVPTWGWLAAGGAVLLATAVQLERTETTPLEQGQRIVHVLTTRFS